MKHKATIGIIGCGNMGEAILARCKKARIFDFLAFEKNTIRAKHIRKKYRLQTTKDIASLVLQSRIILVAVKPQDIESVLEEIKTAKEQSKKINFLIISIAAGVKTAFIEKKIGKGTKVIRAMPNLPAVIGKGVTALVKGRFAGDKDLRIAQQVFRPLGEIYTLTRESLIDAVTAISGSGPAYVAYFFECLCDAGMKLGLDEKSVKLLTRQTVLGAMELLKEYAYDGAAVIAKVQSKGGTTEAALKVFEGKDLATTISNAIVAACARAKELSR